MTCQDFARIESAYLAGALSDAEAREVEAHAASCPACEPRLDAATRRDLAAFAPALPTALRAQTLAAVRSRAGARRNVRRWWGAGIAAAAAVTVLAVGMARFSNGAANDLPTPVASAGRAPSAGALPDSALPDSALTAGAALAMISSRDEFAALDDAIRELESALVATPNDAELRAFLASAKTRRAELERQVKDAA